MYPNGLCGFHRVPPMSGRLTDDAQLLSANVPPLLSLSLCLVLHSLLPARPKDCSLRGRDFGGGASQPGRRGTPERYLRQLPVLLQPCLQDGKRDYFAASAIFAGVFFSCSYVQPAESSVSSPRGTSEACFGDVVFLVDPP